MPSFRIAHVFALIRRRWRSGADSNEIAVRVHSLTAREEKVVRMRFGLEDGSEHTLEEIGLEFAVTRERIRQIEAKALRKLRQPSLSGKLRLFLDDVHE